ncbi:MAG: hypothetical protein ACUVRA_05410 [Candidatus Bathyarchaeaceae archaeon]
MEHISINRILLSFLRLLIVWFDESTKRPFMEGDVLSIEKMKRHAFHLRLLIDSCKSEKVKEKAIICFL